MPGLLRNVIAAEFLEIRYNDHRCTSRYLGREVTDPDEIGARRSNREVRAFGSRVRQASSDRESPQQKSVGRIAELTMRSRRSHRVQDRVSLKKIVLRHVRIRRSIGVTGDADGGRTQIGDLATFAVAAVLFASNLELPPG